MVFLPNANCLVGGKLAAETVLSTGVIFDEAQKKTPGSEGSRAVLEDAPRDAGELSRSD
jgi:hypothetical protein